MLHQEAEENAGLTQKAKIVKMLMSMLVDDSKNGGNAFIEHHISEVDFHDRLMLA
jgi:hypothetical protein